MTPPDESVMRPKISLADWALTIPGTNSTASAAVMSKRQSERMDPPPVAQHWLCRRGVARGRWKNVVSTGPYAVRHRPGEKIRRFEWADLYRWRCWTRNVPERFTSSSSELVFRPMNFAVGSALAKDAVPGHDVA